MIEPKYIFLNELELDSAHRFFLNFKENDSIKQIHISPRKKYFVTNLKAHAKIVTKVKKWKDYDNIVELSNLCQKLIAENEKGISLKKIELVTDEMEFIHKSFSRKLQKRNNYCTIIIIDFMIQQRKKTQITIYLFNVQTTNQQMINF